MKKIMKKLQVVCATMLWSFATQPEPIKHRFRLFTKEYREIIASLKKALAEKNEAQETLRDWQKALKEESMPMDQVIEFGARWGAHCTYPDDHYHWLTNGKYSQWPHEEKEKFKI